MKKIIQFIIFTLISLELNIVQSLADEKIKIGLAIQLSSEYREIGNSILKETVIEIKNILSHEIKKT